jgi:glutamine synthetase
MAPPLLLFRTLYKPAFRHLTTTTTPDPFPCPPPQEYTMLKANSGNVLGWPEGGFPAPQGPFYCGVGVNSVFGRPLAEAHMEACLEAGLTISGINAEVGGCGGWGGREEGVSWGNT